MSSGKVSFIPSGYLFVGVVLLLWVAADISLWYDFKVMTMGGYYLWFRDVSLLSMALYSFVLLLGCFGKYVYIIAELLISLVFLLELFMLREFGMPITGDLALTLLSATRDEVCFFLGIVAKLGME